MGPRGRIAEGFSMSGSADLSEKATLPNKMYILKSRVHSEVSCLVMSTTVMTPNTEKLVLSC